MLIQIMFCDDILNEEISFLDLNICRTNDKLLFWYLLQYGKFFHKKTYKDTYGLRITIEYAVNNINDIVMLKSYIYSLIGR